MTDIGDIEDHDQGGQSSTLWETLDTESIGEMSNPDRYISGVVLCVDRPPDGDKIRRIKL